jgi:glutamate carboxypeptidase
MMHAMQAILDHLKAQTPAILADIERLVRLESPSKDVVGINSVSDVVQSWLAPLGACERIPHELGDTLRVIIPGRSSQRVVLLAHADTVYSRGFWDNLWRVEGDKVFGPGAYDMKGGIVQAVWALKTLKELGIELSHTVEFLLTPDEEIASHAGRPIIEASAVGARAVLVLEPPHLNGDLKVARKGVGVYNVKIHGKAAHQGTEPENGRNALVSAAHFIQEVVKLQDIPKGTTLGPNVIQGGTVSNVVCDLVELEVDLRVWTMDEADRIEAAIHAIQPLDGTRYEISDGLNRPAMEPTEGSLKVLELGQAIAAELGFHPGAARVGGGSDGNFTAKLAPTLDGFGVHGANAHQRNLEYILISELAPRTALIAGMLSRI